MWKVFRQFIICCKIYLNLKLSYLQKYAEKPIFGVSMNTIIVYINLYNAIFILKTITDNLLNSNTAWKITLSSLKYI